MRSGTRARDSVDAMLLTRWWLFPAMLAGLVACGPSGRDDGNGNGDGVDGGGTQDSTGTNGDGCSDAAKLVYVVDENYQLSKFDPMTKTFQDIGRLDCDAAFLATPFSMAIDREANAWVLYNSSELFKVNTTSLACTKTPWTTQQGLNVYGMGFSTDAVGGSTDRLFVAGGPGDVTVATSKLATIDTTTFQAQPLGTVTGWPELTGTGNAELWGFFPSASGSRIEKIDKATGAGGPTYTLAGLAGEPRAWAFAFWGGDFWVFLRKGSEASTTVYQYSAANGQMKGSTPAPGRSIVGAGVSTCAPVVIF